MVSVAPVCIGMSSPLHPRVGMLATIRNRRGLIVSVEDFGGEHGIERNHLVQVEYTDPDGVPEETVLWEREHGRDLMEPHALPRVAHEAPMPPREFDALVRATRWHAFSPFLRPDDLTQRVDRPLASPFFGAVQVDDFQLVPVLRALQMPRVSLLIADDVGLGKTIEAGLVLSELLLRRRIRRVLILSPAALRTQWRQEMRDKFSLTFDMVDRSETFALQKRLGFDANPWRTYPRIIASYHYLRQPDVLARFRRTCEPENPTAAPVQLPWDLLIVDEAHNLMPANLGEDSELAKMLRAISPYFEHKLFLTATPHNGHTRCFTGLLEQLDPVRFTQTHELSEAEKHRIDDVLVRRLKRDINALDLEAGRTPRFAQRYPHPLPLFFGTAETALSVAVAHLRLALKRRCAQETGAGRLAGAFAMEVLVKRLLSSPYTFAESWHRFQQGLAAQDAADAAEVAAAQRSADEDLDDDRERETRARHAVRTVGAWLAPFRQTLHAELEAVDKAVQDLGLVPEGDHLHAPRSDIRFDRLKQKIDELLRQDGRWLPDERLVVFTEYKTTLEYLYRRLHALYPDTGALRVLYGGMDAAERDEIKRAFNDPDDPVRVLLATDAASEGLNLQETARYLLHFDIPWNPARLEQRNGRLDRHGQARDVTIFHFTSENEADLRFMARVVEKVHEMREDLGSVGELFDAAFAQRFQDLIPADDILRRLDHDAKQVGGAAKADLNLADHHLDTPDLEQLRAHIDLSPETLRTTLEVALGSPLEGPDARGRMQLPAKFSSAWKTIIDDTLRLSTPKTPYGPLPALVFDPADFIDRSRARPVFRPIKGTVLLHLGHPVFRHALAVLAQMRFAATHGPSASRWIVRRGPVPPGTDALVRLTLEELAINELREPFHHWVRTQTLPVVSGELGPPLPYESPLKVVRHPAQQGDRARAVEVWDQVDTGVAAFIRQQARQLESILCAHLDAARTQALTREEQRFAERHREVKAALRQSTTDRLMKQLERERKQLAQTDLFAEAQRQKETDLRELEIEIARRKERFEALLAILTRERDRIIDRIVPRRHTLRPGGVQVFPVTVELCLPEGA